MWRFAFGRLLASAPTVLLVVTFTFVCTRAIPGDPTSVLLGQSATEEARAELRQALGVDRPIAVQYVAWLRNAARGDFGTSYYLQRPVFDILLERFPITLGLSVLSLLVSVAVGVPIGVISAAHRNGWVDRVGMVLAVLGMSLPVFWVGFVLIIMFPVTLGWLPTSGVRPLSDGLWPWLRHLVLPVACLSLAPAALLVSTTRAALIDVLRQPYIAAARGRGVGQATVLFKHALRNALVPIAAVVGLLFALGLGGSVLVETVFAIPGLGQLIISAALRRDFPLLEGGMLYLTAMTLLVNFCVDLSQPWLNPRLAQTEGSR